MWKIFPILLIAGSVHAQTSIDYYVQQADQHSPLLIDYNNQIRFSKLEQERLKALYTKAQLSLTGNVLFSPVIANNKLLLNPQTATNYYGQDIGQTSGGLYQGLLNFTQPLNGKALYETAAAQATITSDINVNNIKLGKHDLEKQVRDQYILCLSDRTQQQFADSMVSLIRDQEEIVKKLIGAGLLKQSDFTLLHIEYENNQQLSATWQANYNRDFLDLNLLCGISDSTIHVLDDVQLSLNTTQADTSAFITRYVLDSLNLQAAQKTTELYYKPRLNFLANGGLNTVNYSDIPRRFGVTAGLSFIMPIYDGHQRKITREQTNIKLQTNTAYRSNFQLQNEVRVHKILAELQSYDERLNLSDKQLQDYTALLLSYKKEILQGQLSIINYITVLKSRMTLGRDYLLLKSNQQLLINAYNYWNW
jgi:outer membrane protein TolC